MSVASGIPAQAVEDALDQIMDIEEIVYAALWLGQDDDGTGAALRCTGVRPEGTPVSGTLRSTGERLRWMLETPAFNWRVSGVPIGRLDSEGEPCAYIAFALDRVLMLEVCVLGSARVIASRIDRVHAALAQFSRSLDRPAVTSDPVVIPSEHIDLEFVEAAAMGDRQFIRQILDIAADELAEGVQSLEVAMGAADRDAIHFQAHKIRSTARTVGATELDTRMQAVEETTTVGTTFADLVREGLEEAAAVLQALAEATLD